MTIFDFVLDPLLSLPHWASAVIVIVVAYLIGAIPFSLIVGKVFFGVDLREEGSGNLGATNTFRILGGKAGIAILLIDMAKGALPVFIARFVVDASWPYIAVNETSSWNSELGALLLITSAFAAIIGHTASPYIKFRGGKGAASSAGVMFALVPIVFVISAIIFFSTTAITRYVSVGTILTAVTFPLWTQLAYNSLPLTIFALVIAVVVPVLHKSNIGRLRAGTEPKFSWKNRGQREGTLWQK